MNFGMGISMAFIMSLTGTYLAKGNFHINWITTLVTLPVIIILGFIFPGNAVEKKITKLLNQEYTSIIVAILSDLFICIIYVAIIDAIAVTLSIYLSAGFILPAIIHTYLKLFLPVLAVSFVSSMLLSTVIMRVAKKVVRI